MELSIIICTRNRAALLGQAVDTLLAQDFAPNRYELLIVNDNSTDETPDLARRLGKCHPHIKLLSCQGRGLLAARVTGQNAATGRYLGFFDDDAKAGADWLPQAARIIHEQGPICFGGPFYPFYASPKPRWFKDQYGSAGHGLKPRYLADQEFLNGGNIFFERNALLMVGGFDRDFCSPEDRFTYGDEAVPQLRLRKAFPERKFYYDPRLHILHLVRPERLNLTRQAREAFEMGRGYARLMGLSAAECRRFPYVRRLAGSLLCFLASAAVRSWLRDRHAYPMAANYIFERSFRHLRGAGIYYQHARSISRRGNPVRGGRE
jgi:glucosyl-dolichyl phosphate glucuronosyltransferase